MFLALLLLAAAPKVDARLVGEWRLNGQPFLTLNANGTGAMEGDPLKWRVEGSSLIVVDEDGETDTVPFKLIGEALTLSVGGVGLSLTRGGKAAAKIEEAAPDQLSRLLLSSNWCWLRYSNGNSYTQKVHFNANGTWQDFSESDIYANNQYAQTVSQATGNRSGGGQWQVRAGQLWLSSPDAPQLQPVQLTVTRNSNGYPILNADGREYSMCN